MLLCPLFLCYKPVSFRGFSWFQPNSCLKAAHFCAGQVVLKGWFRVWVGDRAGNEPSYTWGHLGGISLWFLGAHIISVLLDESSEWAHPCNYHQSEQRTLGILEVPPDPTQSSLPRGNHHPHFHHQRFILFIDERSVNGTVYYVLFFFK